MCGICGVYGDEDKNLIYRMRESLFHRGPDDAGIYTDTNLMLGVRRLSIIDVEGGHQPISNEDGSVVVVYNGEIYNYLDLTAMLLKKGHEFKTKSDTEVIVHLYEEYGLNFIQFLRGMFAFAIWDAADKKLILAVDRLGIKPLYYTIVADKFLFASELKALLEYELFKKSVAKDTLYYILNFRYSPSSETIFSGVYRLMPGCMMVVKNHTTQTHTYWDLKPKRILNYPADYYINRLSALLNDSVKMRLMSEVPLGIYLSGGIDSSALVAIAAEHTEKLKTFSFGYKDWPADDERKFAQLVADYYNTEHHEIEVQPENAIDFLPQVIRQFDEPKVDTAAIPLYLLAKDTKKYATVALVGEGADEQFGGYIAYKWFQIANYWRKLNKMPGKKITPAILKRLGAVVPSRGVRLLRYVSVLHNLEKNYLLLASPLFLDTELELILNDAFKKHISTVAPPEAFYKSYIEKCRSNLYQTSSLIDNKIYIPSDILVKVDRMTMAHSVEARVPYLDHRIVEFAITIPPHLKLKKMEKYILRKCMQNRLPKTILNRKKKVISVPVNAWLSTALSLCKALFTKSVVEKRAYFDFYNLQKILKKSENIYRAHQIWGVLTIELWHRMYMDTDLYRKNNITIDDLL